MTVREWVDGASRTGLVCNDYMRKLAAAGTREDLFRVLCDANGGEWLFSLGAKGVRLPVDEFMAEFANFTDGKRVMEYPQGYTSKFYCRADAEDITADTTLVYLLECKAAQVYVPKNRYPSVILSNGSTADIILGDGARLDVDLYGDATFNLVGDRTRVRVTRK